MSCSVREARQGAGIAAEKIRGVRGGGRQQAAWEILAHTYAAYPEPGAGGEGPQPCQDLHEGLVGQLSAPEQLGK